MQEQSFNNPYQPPPFFRNKYFNTIFTNLWRETWFRSSYVRKRIETTDQDFLDLDLASAGSNKALLLVHGLEGDAYAPYVKGMVKAAKQAGWDAVSLNLRGCSGTINWQPNIYHSGRSEDLDTALYHLIEKEAYQDLAIVGFSLGGNLALKYAGEQAQSLDERIKAVTAVSVPFDLENVAMNMDQFSNLFFRYRFLSTLKQKALEKKAQFPDLPVDKKAIQKSRKFYEFDNVFTAPVHGFKDASDYWHQSSSLYFLKSIKCSTLMINAQDDPFIPPNSIPTSIIHHQDQLEILTPRYGGHVGFGNWRLNDRLWHEDRIMGFLQQQGL